MKKTNLLKAVLTAFLINFSACNNEEVLTQYGEIQLTSEIADSRVVNQNLQSTQIVAGQQVGVFIDGAKTSHSNVKWVAGANGVLTTATPAYWGNGNVTITAYHPYNASCDGSPYTFSVKSDQSTDANYLNSDLLWTTATSAKTNNPVSLTFGHVLSKITVSLTGDNIADLSGATISICGTKTSGLFNPISSDLSNLGSEAEVVAGYTATNTYTAAAIIIPQEVKGGARFIKLAFDDKTYYYTLPQDKYFQRGCSYSYELKVASEKLIEVSSNIIDWNDEITSGDLQEEIVVKHVNVTTPGTLSDLVPMTEKYGIKTLVVSGNINGDDVRFIREMAGFDVDGNETNGQLINLDLRNANIVAGGGSYINADADFWGFVYDDEGNMVGQSVLDTKYTQENNSSYMFIGLKQLEELILPAGLVNLGDMTFYGCSKLKSLTLPASIDYSLSYSQHFHACLSLESINVEEGNPYLFSRDGALYADNEGYITLLAIPAARKTFTLTSDIDQIDSYAIPLGSSLEELIITEDAPELKPYFYDNLFFLQNFIVDEENKRYATIDGVLYSKDLSTIECYPSGRTASSYEIPQGVTAIGDGCFNTSWHLSEIIIPEGVETIGESAFFTCYNLHELTLPATVKNIGAYAFQHLHMMKFTCKALTPPILYDECVLLGNYEKICVPVESVELYKQSDYWNLLADVICPIE